MSHPKRIITTNMSSGTIQVRFYRADQEGILLLLDDDMEMGALPDTNIMKSIVTLEDKFDLERKGKQSVQGVLYVRLMGFGNGQFSSLHDRSDGFYRRQICLQTRPKEAGRIDDRDLGEKLIAEKEGIALWMLEGLHRLIENGFEFTISERSRLNMEEARQSDNNIIEFLGSRGYVSFEKGTMATTRQLYIAYRRWCDDNLEKPFLEKTFSKYLKQNAAGMGIEYDKNLPGSGGKTARGYHGIYVEVRTEGYQG
jgi:putative DNA primase/helicase